MRLIDANNLMEYCHNLKDKKIDCNDIARFPTAYNVDDVMEELDKYLAPLVGRNAKLYTTVMEIVKAGGKNDD